MNTHFFEITPANQIKLEAVKTRLERAIEGAKVTHKANPPGPLVLKVEYENGPDVFDLHTLVKKLAEDSGFVVTLPAPRQP